MPSATVVAPLLVAAVLLVSGVAKLRDPGSVRAAFESLDVPTELRRPWLEKGFPSIEVALGVLLLLCPWPLNVLVALAALGLMLAYAWLVWRALRRPEPVDCHCFGALTTGRVTRLTLARNVTLAVFALVALVDAFAGTLVTRLYASETLAWLVAFAASGWLAYTVLGDRRARPDAGGPHLAPSVSEDEEGDYVRLPIPYGTLDAAGEARTLRDLAKHRAALLIWVSPTCGACAPVIEALPGWRRELAGRVDVRPVLASVDSLADTTPELVEGALQDVEYRTQRLFDAWGNPMAVLLGADGLLAGGPVTGAGAGADLVDHLREQLAGTEVPGPAEKGGRAEDAPAPAEPAAAGAAEPTTPEAAVRGVPEPSPSDAPWDDRPSEQG